MTRFIVSYTLEGRAVGRRTVSHQNYCGVYIVTDGTAAKIGITNDVHERIKVMQTGNPRPITLHAFIHASSITQARRAELAAHGTLGAVRLQGEWFAVTPEIAASVVQAALDGKPDSYGSVAAMSQRAMELLKRIK